MSQLQEVKEMESSKQHNTLLAEEAALQDVSFSDEQQLAAAATIGLSSATPWYKFQNVKRAQGYNTLGTALGAMVMSNIFLASSLIFLASKDADCLTESGDEVIDDCDNKVYGFKPTSLISNIAVISGLLSALVMPLAGAMTDYTPYRRSIGVASAIIMILIQIAQIGTVSATWFAMSILQAASGFLYHVEVLATYSYLPEISREVGEATMTSYTATFAACQIVSQASFLFSVIALSFVLGLDTVQLAQLSQAVNVVWSGIGFVVGWRLMPSAPASRKLPPNTNILTAGFVKNIETTKLIHKEYSDGLQWYLLAVIFAEAGVSAFTTLAVVYLDEQVNLTASEIGIFFLLTLLCALPGAFLGSAITSSLNPKQSWQLSLASLIVVTAGGAYIVDFLPKYVTFVWGGCIGLLLGWYYPAKNLSFSMLVPKSQEAEMAGFFVYCTQILGWAPPLIFTLLVENDVSKTHGVMMLSFFFLAAILLMGRSAPWDQIVACKEDADDVPRSSEEDSLAK